LPGKVIVIEYDPDWPALYKQEQIRILAAIGEYIDDIQHVGSTSVPGLGAKPIIDIMIALPDLMLVERCVQPMLQLGYEYREMLRCAQHDRPPTVTLSAAKGLSPRNTIGDR